MAFLSVKFFFLAYFEDISRKISWCSKKNENSVFQREILNNLEESSSSKDHFEEIIVLDIISSISRERRMNT